MAINIRTKGAEGEREVARALNDIVDSVFKKLSIPLPPAPVYPLIQRNQNQSAVGGSDLTNPFGLAIEVKRQETPLINTWWKQCVAACNSDQPVPVLIYRANRKAWRVVMLVDVPLGESSHVKNVRAEIEWDEFQQWFQHHVHSCLIV